eukprot:120244-Amphidinium_carterae.1
MLSGSKVSQERPAARPVVRVFPFPEDVARLQIAVDEPCLVQAALQQPLCIFERKRACACFAHSWEAHKSKRRCLFGLMGCPEILKNRSWCMYKSFAE